MGIVRIALIINCGLAMLSWGKMKIAEIEKSMSVQFAKVIIFVG
jgi:hypothetical protein